MAFTSTQLTSARGQLDKTKQQLAMEQKAAAEQRARLDDLERKLKDARDTIAKIASVKDDDRGMVITLQGEALFPTAKWDLNAGPMAKAHHVPEPPPSKAQPVGASG